MFILNNIINNLNGFHLYFLSATFGATLSDILSDILRDTGGTGALHAIGLGALQ